MEPRTLADDMDEDLDVCRECTGTWKVACYGAWCPNSQFWDDFLEDGWEDSAYSPRACCLRMMCGILFWFFAPLWCCKAILFVLFWPCVCCCRAIKEGNCNRRYFKIRRSKNSQPLAYIESAHPTHPVRLHSPDLMHTQLIIHRYVFSIISCDTGPSCLCILLYY